MIEIKGLHKHFGPLHVLKGIDLSVGTGEVVCIIGPSGSGKSTLLRCINHLEVAEKGEIRIDGQVAYRDGAEGGFRAHRSRSIAAVRAQVGMVFQNFNLFPHLTAIGNIIEAPVHVLRRPRDVALARARELLAQVGLSEKADSYPEELSGGQQQRVAVARSLVLEPAVLLFDEPLSNLDAKLRVDMRVELNRLHHSLATTMIYVTHDQVEAMTLADRIVILNHGRIEQIGTPEEVYDTPATVFVAGFIGAPPMNLVPAEALPDHSARHGVLVGVRPEHLVWHKDPGSGSGAPFLSGRATVVEPLGSDTLVSLDVAGTPVIARLAPRLVRKAGEEVALSADPANIHFFDRATGARL